MSDNLAYDLWLPLTSQVDEDARGLSDLTDEQQTLLLAYDFVCQFANGGLSGYGYNKTAPMRKALVAALDRLDAPQSAQLMRRANKILNKSVPPESFRTWDEFLAIADPDDQLEQLHNSLADQLEAEGVHESVEKLAATMSERNS